jgi:probable selenium-dependent hydroxylase accessory protein YqeC
VTRDYLTLVEALGIPRGSIVALVGGGGKTSTLFRLVRESTRDGCRVLATTTARMKMEEIAEMRDVLLWDERDVTGETWHSHRAHTADAGWLDKALAGDEEPAIPAAFLGRSIMRDKLIGLPTDYLGDLLSRLTWDMVYVEADGSRGRSIKGHRLGEPALPLCATHCVIVVGADGFESTVHEETCHRPEVVQELLRLDWGEHLTPTRVAELLGHPRGLLTKIPGDMEVSVYVNKAPLGGEHEPSRTFAEEILQRTSLRIKRVAVGDNLQGGLVETFSPDATP